MDKKTNVFYLHRDELKQMDEYYDSIGDHHDWHRLTGKYCAKHYKEHQTIRRCDLDKMQHDFIQWVNGKSWDEIMAG